MEYYSAIKKNKIMPFAATWMDLEIVILSEVSQTKEEEYCMASIIYVESKMKWHEFAYKTETDSENEFMVAGEKDGREGLVRVFGMVMYTLLYLKWVTNKDLLYSTWNSAQCYVAAWRGV